SLQSELANSLLDEGYLVTPARDGQEAIARLRHNSKIRLVIYEFETPNQSDLMFLSYRLHNPMLSKIPVVLIGACSTNQLQQLAMHLGATVYFAKPYSAPEFLSKLKQLTQLTARNESD
ncbi:MAG: response regulator, partial [Cyanobacteria bacterium P01_A01_bin.17]